MLFETRNNVPDIYTKASRDFQLISSAFDCMYNALINNQLKLNYIDSLEIVDAKLLDLIKDYLGFFTDQYYPENLLRSILINFPSAIKYKGSIEGIKIAVEALQNAYTDISNVNIKRKEVEGQNNVYDNTQFSISTDGVIINQNYIEEVLKYVLPIGAIVDQILVIQDMNNLTPDRFGNTDTIIGIRFGEDNSEQSEYTLGTIRKSYNIAGNGNLNYFLSKVGQTPIVKKALIKKVSIKKL